jgi:uncharacterized protein (DUF2236 family)
VSVILSDHQSGISSGRSPKEPGAAPLGPDSLIWRLGLPRTALLLAGRGLLLQTMHPVVGAGVRDFSTFRSDPWGRLDRTLDSLQVQLFGGAQAVNESERLRRLHKTIRGIGFDGEHYSALNPEAYAWVHLSNFDTLLSFNRWFGRSLTLSEQRRLYAEWQQVGRVLGVRGDHIPPDLHAFRAYVKDMVAHTLRDNDTARELLDSLRLEQIGSPPWRLFPESLWRALRPFGRQLLHDTTVGTLPSGLRQRLGLPWTAADRRRLQGIAVIVRAGSLPVPARLLQYPLGYRAQSEARRAGAQRSAS